MATLEVTNDQLRLIQQALDLYSRVGIGQMWPIVEHPTFEKHVKGRVTKKGPIQVGDRTNKGKVLEVGDDWVIVQDVYYSDKEPEKWSLKEVRHSTNYTEYHKIMDMAKAIFAQARNILIGENMNEHASWGIGNINTDESCQEAFDIIQVIRHEFWKHNPDRSDITVDSSVTLFSGTTQNVKCTIDKEEK